jgi:hypothetical protein
MVKRDLLLCVLATLGATAACETPLCDPEADPAARYRLEILDEYDSASRFAFVASRGRGLSYVTCAGTDGLQPGAALELQASGKDAIVGDTCLLVTANLVTGPATLTPLGPSSDATATLEAKSHGSMYAVEDVSFGACNGVLILQTFGASDDPAVEGQLPPVILYRLFLPAPSSSCQACDDNFVVQLSKI